MGRFGMSAKFIPTSSGTSALGGSGGGHDKACGASVPKSKIKKFLTELDKNIK